MISAEILENKWYTLNPENTSQMILVRNAEKTEISNRLNVVYTLTVKLNIMEEKMLLKFVLNSSINVDFGSFNSYHILNYEENIGILKYLSNKNDEKIYITYISLNSTKYIKSYIKEIINRFSENFKTVYLLPSIFMDDYKILLPLLSNDYFEIIIQNFYEKDYEETESIKNTVLINNIFNKNNSYPVYLVKNNKNEYKELDNMVENGFLKSLIVKLTCNCGTKKNFLIYYVDEDNEEFSLKELIEYSLNNRKYVCDECSKVMSNYTF